MTTLFQNLHVQNDKLVHVFTTTNFHDRDNLKQIHETFKDCFMGRNIRNNQVLTNLAKISCTEIQVGVH